MTHSIRLGSQVHLGYRIRMTETETRILNKLLELETAVATMSTASPKPDLLTIFTELDQYAAELPVDADPDLRHYLQRKSYQKAQLLLQGRNEENKRGVCGR